MSRYQTKNYPSGLSAASKLKFIKGKILETKINEISLSYKVANQTNVELTVIYTLNGLESFIKQNKNASLLEIQKQPLIDFSYFILKDRDNVTRKGFDKGIKSEDPKDIEGHFGLTEEDLTSYVFDDAFLHILKYFREKNKAPKKKVIGIEESFEFEKLFAKILNS